MAVLVNQAQDQVVMEEMAEVVTEEIMLLVVVLLLPILAEAEVAEAKV